MDRIDLRILELLQRDAAMPMADLAGEVGLSSTPCWRRVRRLETDGVIRSRVALLDPERINLGTTVFVAVRTNQHSLGWLESFRAAASGIPEITQIYRMSGEIDYLLKVAVPSISAYDSVYKKLIGAVKLADVSSSFAMEQLKYTTALPLSYIDVTR